MRNSSCSCHLHKIFLVVESIDQGASLYGITIQSHQVCLLLKQLVSDIASQHFYLTKKKHI